MDTRQSTRSATGRVAQCAEDVLQRIDNEPNLRWRADVVSRNPMRPHSKRAQYTHSTASHIAEPRLRKRAKTLASIGRTGNQRMCRTHTNAASGSPSGL